MGLIFHSFSPCDTAKIAGEFAEKARPGDIFCLKGGLGAGKTTFCRGFAKGIGCEGRVTSPTFTIMNIYEGGRLPVYHFDLYRLDAAGLESVGYEDYFYGEGVSLVEWPERAGDIFEGAIFVEIRAGFEDEDYREITIENLSD